ncbi:hypothetical protein [Deinococcus hopiensis]|uniref:Uncharacterized protein n=1 Tax=Deinococcus hopiensis KR-140 TaxID=695939 RepID=A0A1W1VLA8_9DEIO|nr:hypothetical protein [Deinococcus hopiensis]SMB94175.1 hypothetical protein SAMN00790413_02277 [Deinococcus hopiensis KR-140]
MKTSKEKEAQFLARLAGGAAGCIVSGGTKATALRELLQTGHTSSPEEVLDILHIFERATGGEFGLAARSERAAREVERVVGVAYGLEPDVLDRVTLSTAPWTVERVTEHLVSSRELQAITQGAGVKRVEREAFRATLLRDSGVMYKYATQRTRDQLDQAGQVFRNLTWACHPHHLILRDASVSARDRELAEAHHLSLNLRLGLVLLGSHHRITAGELWEWVAERQPEVLVLAAQQVRVLRALGEGRLTCCWRVKYLLKETLALCGAVHLSMELSGECHALFDLAMEIERAA